MFSRRKHLILIALVAGLALLSSAVYVAFFRGGAAKPAGTPLLGDLPGAEVRLAPTKADATGVDLTASFQLTAEKPLSEAQVRQSLSVNPAVELRVVAAGSDGKAYTITPAKALEAGKVYRFRLAARSGVSRDYQWSFQTRSAFRVLGTLPRHQATGVPVNTGIEIAFSHEQFGDVAPYFAISPAVEGRFERHKRTVSFVPKDPLKPGTVYTVTLKQGLPLTGTQEKLAAETVFAFETQPEAEGKATAYFDIPTDLQEFAVGQTPFFAIYTKMGAALDVTVWKYPDATLFMAALAEAEKLPYWASYTRSRRRAATTGLTKQASIKGEVKQYADLGSFLLFPDPLPAGFYLAEFALDGNVRQVRVQVTDLATYTAVTSTRSLLWVNDLTTGRPAPGAAVTGLSGGSARTDAKGVALLPMGTYFHVQAGAKEAVAGAPQPNYPYYYSPEGRNPDRYWKYLYLDRGLYKPDDPVNLFGILKPREAGAPVISGLVAEVTRSEYRALDNAPVVFASERLQVEESTFTGKLQLPSLRPGHYTLQVRSGDDILMTRWFEVAAYTKPAYTIDVTPTRKAVMLDETLEFRVKATFFEGTPVPGLSLQYNLDGRQETLVTDAAGEAVVTYTARSPGGEIWGPHHASFNIHANLPEAGEISAWSGIQAYMRNVVASATTRVEGSTGMLSGQVHHVDIAGLNAGTTQDVRGKPAAGRKVMGRIVRQDHIKIETGESYDFINKVVTKTYRYEPDPKEIARFTVTTDSEGKFSYTFPVEKEKGYEIRFETEDTRGLMLSSQAWLYGSGGSPYSRYRWYNLSPTKPTETYRWAVGAPVELRVLEDQSPVPDRADSFLFMNARLGLQSYEVMSSNSFRHALQEADLPNTTIRAVYFDGRQYREAQEYTLRIEPKERALTVSVTADKLEYRPGETVQVTVSARDRTGRPTAGTRVNINLVDEAVYALSGQHVNLLESLYGDVVPSGIIRTRGSHYIPEMRGGAEKGGEGGGVRRDFKDTVIFTTVTTGADGTARVSFIVPDDLTTWRLTYNAIHPRTLEGASGTLGISVKLPFFADVVLAETYLTGDQPVVTVRSYGAKLAKGDAVEFEITVTGPGDYKETASATGRAFEAVTVPVKRLAAIGEYNVVVRAEGTGGLTDALEKSVQVVDSYLRQRKADFQLLTPETRITGAAKGLTMLTFTDYERSPYLRLLQQLSWTWGNRFEQKLARTMAQELLVKHFGQDREWWWGEVEADLTAFQTEAGSIAILPYSDGDLRLSALAADIAGDRLDRVGLATYFQKVLDDKQSGREQVILATYGLAALQEPVLPAVQSLLALKELTLDERLCLAMAAAALGDLESARAVYHAVAKENGEQMGSLARITAGKSQEEYVVDTAMAAALAARLGEPHAAAFMGYLSENWPKENVILLERLIAAKEGLALLPRAEAASVTYVLDGVEQRLAVKPGQSPQVAVRAEGLAGLKFTKVEGKLAVTAQYDAPLDTTLAGAKNGAKVTRSYKPAEGSLKAGDLVEVTLTYSIPDTAPGGSYEIADYLPSGLRLVQKPWDFGVKLETRKNYGWPLEVLGNRVTFYASKEGNSALTYFARVVSPGSYTAEQPVLQHQTTGQIYGMGLRTQVQIK